MLRIEAVVALFPGLETHEVRAWIERGWVRPEGGAPAGTEAGAEATGGEAWLFAEVDVARVRLVRDLRHEMGVAEDTLPLVLSLMDQLYAARGALKAVRRAVESQPDPVRRALLAALRDPG